MLDCEKRIRRVLREHRQWLSRSEDFVQRELDYLRSDLAEPRQAVPANVADALEGLGFYWGVQAVIGGRAEEPDACRSLGRSIEYYLWSLLIRAHGLHAGGPDFSNHVSLLGSVACSGIAYKQTEIVRPATQLLLRVATSKHLMDPLEWKNRRFEPFVLQLCSRIQGSELPPSIAPWDLGIYAELLSTRVDEDAFRRACDLHCSNMEDRGQNRNPEFKDPPFDLVPVEVLAAIETMRRNGQVVNVPDHPLLNTPLIALAAEFPVPNSDPDLERAQDYYVGLEVEN